MGKDFAENALIFGVDNSSSSHNDNGKNNFLVLGKSPTYGSNASFVASEKKVGINFSKAKTKFALSLHYNHDNSYSFFNEK